MPITIAEDNFMGEPGVLSTPMQSTLGTDFGVNERTDLTPITDRTATYYSGAWETYSWARVVGGILYYKHIGLCHETPPDWATHIYKPLTY